MAQRKQSATAMMVLSGIIAVLVCVAGYVGLVMREQSIANRTEEYAEKLELELGRGRGYLRGGEQNAQLLAEAESARQEIARRIPIGRTDYEVVRFLEDAAREAGLPDFSYDFAGGMALPEDPEEGARTAPERLKVDPAKLRSVVLNLGFYGNYQQILAFREKLANADWIFEELQLDLQRVNPDEKDDRRFRAPQTVKTEHKELGIQAKLVTRYYYQ